MGYSVISYLTNATEIKRIYGCKDEGLRASLLIKLTNELEDLNDYFEEYITENTNCQEILTDIINGDLRFPELAFMYGYVYEKLCEHFGEQIFPPNEDFSTNYYWAVPKQTYKAFIPIPFSDDFPEIYSIAITDLQTEKDKFLALTKKDGISESDFKIEKQDYEYTFNKAIELNKDLVFFLY